MPSVKLRNHFFSDLEVISLFFLSIWFRWLAYGVKYFTPKLLTRVWGLCMCTADIQFLTARGRGGEGALLWWRKRSLLERALRLTKNKSCIWWCSTKISVGLNSFGIIGTIRTIKTIRTIRTIRTITRSGITLWFRPLVFLFATVLIVLKVSIVSFFLGLCRM